jgi:Fe-S-cluster-containing dehydrogenase component
VVHLSMACNHCEKPVCLEGCPAGSYSREPVTGGIIADENKCIGCSYCEWNCPYEALKINLRKGIIEKCNLCYGRLSEGLEPACTSACPTGALCYGTIPDPCMLNKPGWFPDKGLNPAIWFSGSANR